MTPGIRKEDINLVLQFLEWFERNVTANESRMMTVSKFFEWRKQQVSTPAPR